MSITPSSSNIVPIIKKETILNALERGIRIDGRRFNDYRKISVIVDYVKKAEGSALVKLGDTTVVAGIKLDEGKPFEDTPNQGNLFVNVEFLPLAYESFEPGPPDENAIELARVIDRSLRDSKAIDLSKLVIIPNTLVWNVWIDVYVLDYGGNVTDASMLASIIALYNTYLPKIKVNENKVEIDRKEKDQKLPMLKPVLTVTIGKIGKFLFVDPDLEEEGILEAKISFSYTSDGNIVGIQKYGHGSFSISELIEAENLGRSVSQRLFEEL
ncbi:MAG: exosome complex protein Rrp42, partial [Sulfolobaceae archaeon]